MARRTAVRGNSWVNAGSSRRAFNAWNSQGGLWTPARLNPFAWYDAQIGGSSTQIIDSSANGRAAATFGAGSNAPLYLPYTGTPYLYNTVSNGLIYSVNATGFASGDRTVRVNVLPDNWASASDWLAGTTANGELLTLRKLSATSIRFMWRTSSNTLVTRDVAVSNLGTLAGSGPLWIEGALDVDDGAGNHVVVVRTSTDGVTWTERGRVTTAGVTTCVPTSSVVSVGGSASWGYSGQVLAGRLIAGFQGGIVEANFDASLCGQSGYVDAVGSLGGTWTVSRATAGRKAVVLSPAANSARSTILFGTDDWIDVPAAAIPPLDTFAAPSSIVAVFRRWHNPGTSGHPIFATKASSADTVLGFAYRLSASAASTTFETHVGDGTTNDTAFVSGANTAALGVRAVGYSQVGNVSPFVRTGVNTAAPSDDTARATTVSTSTAGAGRIGAYLSVTSPIDMEFEALLTFDRALSAVEISRLVTYYGGGL